MSLPPDYHLHTALCRHAQGLPHEYATAARQRGLREMGFSDHSPMRDDHFDNWRMRFGELETYVRQVEDARRQHPDLIIRLALEVDYLPGQEAWIRQLRSLHPWDYFIGSVHYVSDTWEIDNPEKRAEWSRRDPDEVWATYVDRLIQAAQTGCFEIIGHLDLPKKFRDYPRTDCLPLFERFLDVARAADVAIEVNTAGLRKDCREIYPARRILESACRKGVPITFGSDAHAASEVGQDLDQAVALARAVGYTHSCCFAGRQRQLRPLPQ